MLKWVKLNRYYELSGDTQDAFYSKKRKAIWREGVQFRTAADGAVWINLEAVNSWAEKSKHIA